MTTAPDDLKAIQTYCHTATGLDWTALGIVHGTPQGGGYHEGLDLLQQAGRAPGQTRTDYSWAESSRDRNGLSDHASAFDLGGDFARFREITLGIVGACQHGDPRTRDVREVIYTPDGVVVRRWDRLGIRTSGDSSHLSHTHISFFRDALGRRNNDDNFGGLLRELFAGTGGGLDMAGLTDAQALDLYNKTTALWQLGFFGGGSCGPETGMPQINPGGPAGSKPNSLVDHLALVRLQLVEVLTKIGIQTTILQGVHDLVATPTTVTLSPGDLAAITAGLAALVPTAQQIAVAVLDEQHRRDAD